MYSKKILTILTLLYISNTILSANGIIEMNLPPIKSDYIFNRDGDKIFDVIENRPLELDVEDSLDIDISDSNSRLNSDNLIDLDNSELDNELNDLGDELRVERVLRDSELNNSELDNVLDNSEVEDVNVSINTINDQNISKSIKSLFNSINFNNSSSDLIIANGVEDNNSDIIIDINKSDGIKEVRENLINTNSLKIAILISKKAQKSYQEIVSSTLLAYYIYKDSKFIYQFFTVDDENISSISDKMNIIDGNNFQNIIVILEKKGVLNLLSVLDNRPRNIYIPTLHISEIKSIFENRPKNLNHIIFAGIDYDRQVRLLLSKSATKVAILAEDNNFAKYIGSIISNIVYYANKDITFNKPIKDINNLITYYIKNNRHLNRASIFISSNSIVKGSLILSELYTQKIDYYNILLTQPFYNYNIFDLIQNRNSIIVVNMIDINNLPFKYLEYNRLLKSPIEYNWISYSVALGISKLSKDKLFKEDIIDNQVQYNYKLYTIKSDKYVEI
jgi:hypothetical protein